MNLTQKSKLQHMLYKFPLLYKLIFEIYCSLKVSYKEKHVCYGELNKEKTFYIIKPNGSGKSGLLALFNYFINETYYAITNGFIPFIDLKNYKSQYYNGEDNTWEWFFSQPSSYKIEEIYNSKNVIISGNKSGKEELVSDQIFNIQKAEKANTFFNTYFKVNDKIFDLVNKESEKIDIWDCIGVIARGTDYTQIKPFGEKVQPNIEQLFLKIDEFLSRYEKRKIFLVTEDKEISDKFKERFGNLVYCPSFEILIDKEKWDGNDFISASTISDDLFFSGAQYLAKILLLSKCKYLICGIVGGSKAAMLFNGGEYEDKYIFDLGVYK